MGPPLPPSLDPVSSRSLPLSLDNDNSLNSSLISYCKNRDLSECPPLDVHQLARQERYHVLVILQPVRQRLSGIRSLMDLRGEEYRNRLARTRMF